AVHSILRRYTGWYDGNPSMLFPSTRAEIAREVLALAGGPGPVLARARALQATGELADVQRALHLVDFVIAGGGPEDASARALKADLLAARVQGAPGFSAVTSLRWAGVWERGCPARQSPAPAIAAWRSASAPGLFRAAALPRRPPTSCTTTRHGRTSDTGRDPRAAR